jgi:hypothetical protein
MLCINAPKKAYPIVVMKLVVKESSENRRRRQDFPTPADVKRNVQLVCGDITKQAITNMT